MNRKRKFLKQSKARRVFSHTAAKVHPKNILGHPMRGGIRL